MGLLSFLAAMAGLLLLAWRMWPRPFSAFHAPSPALPPSEDSWPSVSIVVPARNEEAVLGELLDSLLALDYPSSALELIVVDDGSEDQTAAIARARGVRLISGRARPEGWNGKQWACHQGAEAARGELLLFTDADTVHDSWGLKTAVSALLTAGAQGLTALPYHRGQSWWERLSGPFHVWLLAATNPYGKPRPGQVYAIGQYLLFERRAYEKLGGHARVKSSWVEDIPLARALLEDGGRWQVFTARKVFEVRMYATLGDFIRGWRRNFRAGMSYSYPGTGLEMTLFMAALLGSGAWFRSGLAWAFTGLSCALLLLLQRRLGRFSWAGPLLFPFSLGLFCSVTALALFDLVTRRPQVWKNRSYATPQAS